MSTVAPETENFEDAIATSDQVAAFTDEGEKSFVKKIRIYSAPQQFIF